MDLKIYIIHKVLVLIKSNNIFEIIFFQNSQ